MCSSHFQVVFANVQSRLSKLVSLVRSLVSLICKCVNSCLMHKTNAKLQTRCLQNLQNIACASWKHVFFTFCKLGLHLQCLCACNIYVFETCAMLCSATHAQLLVCATSVRLMWTFAFVVCKFAKLRFEICMFGLANFNKVDLRNFKRGISKVLCLQTLSAHFQDLMWMLWIFVFMRCHFGCGTCAFWVFNIGARLSTQLTCSGVHK